MLFLNLLLFFIAVLALIIGIAYILRFWSYMARGVGMSSGVSTGLSLIGAFNLVLGIVLFIYAFPRATI